MNQFNNWWVEYRMSGEYKVPFSPCKKAIQSDTKPDGNYWGAYHCSECAHIRASFGKTEDQAWAFNHGTLEEQYGVFLSGD